MSISHRNDFAKNYYTRAAENWYRMCTEFSCNVTFRLVCVDVGIYGVPAPNTSAFAKLYSYPIKSLKNRIIRSCQKSTYAEQRYLYNLFATPALGCSEYHPKDSVANWCGGALGYLCSSVQNHFDFLCTHVLSYAQQRYWCCLLATSDPD